MIVERTSPKDQMASREFQGAPSTDRVKKLLDRLYESRLKIDSERCRLYTEWVRKHWSDPFNTRQGGALKHVLSNLTPVINEGELIVGQISRYFRGTQLYPEYETWFLEEFKGEKREEEKFGEGSLRKTEVREGEVRIGIFAMDSDEARVAQEVSRYWEENDLRSVAERNFIPEEDVSDFLDWLAHGLVAPPGVMWDVPEGRVIVDYERVLQKGLESIIEECDDRIDRIGVPRTEEEFCKKDFYKGVKLACEGVIKFAENYAEEAEKIAAGTKDPNREEKLVEIASILKKVPRGPAETFREALQSFWMVHTALFVEENGRGISPGRFDQYMYPFYREDIKEGRITRKEVLELMELLRIKCNQIVRAHPSATEGTLGGSIFQNLTLGGLDKNGKPADNELSKIILEAGINASTEQPTLSVRWNDKESFSFKKQAIDTIKAGNGYPAIFCDEPAIESLRKMTKAPEEDLYDWAPCGCVDMQICGKRAPMHAILHISGPKILELILNDGYDPKSGHKNELFDTQINFEGASVEEIKDEFFRILEIIIRKLGRIENSRMFTHNKVMGLTLPFTSALLDDCMEEGMHCQEGGCRYSDSPYYISCGFINVVNSLASIEKNITEEGNFTHEGLLKALGEDFEGHEGIQKLCLEAPKYGNDFDKVDEHAKDLYDRYSELVQKQYNWMGGPYRPSTLSVVTQTVLGKAAGATPDGREAGLPFADGSLSPHPGTDQKGPTAVLKSASKVDASNLQSTLLNLKFHPAVLEGETNAEKFVSFNDAYRELGGYHVQYNVVDSDMLKDAQEHPEQYQDLMVRVAGFTARFVDLGEDAQSEIIKRSEHMRL